MFTIFHTFNMGRSRTVEANVGTLDEAEFYLADLGDVVLFEQDSDNPGCADAAVFHGGDLHIYAIEAAI